MSNHCVHDTINCYPTHLVTFSNGSNRRHASTAPLKNHHNGKLSAKSTKRLKRAIAWIDAITPIHEEIHPITRKPFNMKLNFITLTLCAPQMHSDIEIKSQMLHPWLNNVIKRFKLKHYAWRAESQKNGSIHFHFVTNVFMHLYYIRRAWNRRQKELGYIKKYREAQQAWHRDGFRPRPDLFSKWPLHKQRKAYERGVKTNWSDPNSTDVHSLSRVENVVAYISKYMAKQAEGTCPICKRSTHFSQLPDTTPLCKSCNEPLIITRPRPIEGRQWFISQALSQCKPLQIAVTPESEAELYIQNNYTSTCLSPTPYASIYLIKPADFKHLNNCHFHQLWQAHCTRLFHQPITHEFSSS